MDREREREREREKDEERQRGRDRERERLGRKEQLDIGRKEIYRHLKTIRGRNILQKIS